MKYEEARELFYELVDGLLETINKTEYLTKYFYHTPVGYEDLFFSLSFDYQGKGFLKKGDVYQITIIENEIMYHILDEDGPVEMKQKAVGQDIYILEGFYPKMHAIRHELPEKEDVLSP